MNKKRKDGYFRTSFTFDDKRYYIYGKNKQELLEKETQKRKELESNLQKREDPTIEEYFDRWLRFHENEISPNTYRTNELRKKILCSIEIPNINKTLGEMKLKKLLIDDIKEVQFKLAESRKTTTVNSYMFFLKRVINDAMKERIIDYNPFVLVKPLKVHEDKARDTYHRALSIEEQTTFFNAECVKNSIFYNVYRFAVVTGMRIGEIGALMNKDIKDGYIYVERTLTRIHGDVWGIGQTTKTYSGKRRIPLTDDILKVLTDQKRRDHSGIYNIVDFNDLIFKSQYGKIIRHTKINKELHDLCKQTGIDPITMHSFRDTFATRAIESGMQPKTLQEILGHKDYAITMNLYAHVMDETKEREMKNLHINI